MVGNVGNEEIGMGEVVPEGILPLGRWVVENTDGFVDESLEVGFEER